MSATAIPGNLASQLRRSERRKKAFAISLTLPLLIFLLAIFIVPIGALLVRAVEKPLLEVVMAQASNNQSKAAQWLGLNRNTLRKKLLDHKLVE